LLNEPRWVTPDGVIQLNLFAVGETGEPHLLKSRDLVESACARPQHRWHYYNTEDVVDLGCVLLLAIARNHPFLQGNKRTAFAAMVAFLGANNYRFEISDHAPNAEHIIAAIEGRMSDEEFTAAMRPHVRRA
jgi:death-on-curing protein